MNDMEITSDWIDRYNEHELNDEEQACFIKRMDENPLLRTEVDIDACLNRLYQDEGTWDLMKKIEAASNKNYRKAGKPPYLLIAASLLFLIALGALVKLMQVDPAAVIVNAHGPRPIFSQKPGGHVFSLEFLKIPAQVKNITPVTRRKISSKQHLAMNYKPMASYELLVGSVTRSAHLKLVAPTATLKIPAGTTVVFTWVYQERIRPVCIVFYDNRGNQVAGTPALLEGSYKLSTKNWQGGIYYWKIIVDEEMTFMGKIILI